MNFQEIDQQLQRILTKPKGNRVIKKITLFDGEIIYDAQAVDNLYAAKQFLVSEFTNRFETVVDYANVENILIELNN